MRFAVLVCAVVLCFATLAGNKLQNDVAMVTGKVDVGGRNFQAMEGYIGIGKSAVKTSQLFQYNFGRATTVIGDIGTAQWGIQCDDSKDKYINSCRVECEDTILDYYLYSAYKYKQASLFYRFNSIDKLTVQGIDPLPVQLVVSNMHWPTGNLGVLGLAPYGDFANYVRRMWVDSTSLLFAFSPVDNTVPNDQLDFNTHVVLNPVFSNEKNGVVLQMEENAKTWNYVADVSVGDTEFKFPRTNVCFSSLTNEIIAIIDPIILCDEVLQTICDGPGAACNKESADLKNGPSIDFVFKNTKLSIKAEQYIYFDASGVAACRFGNLFTLRAQQVCSEDTQVAVGKMFYQIYMPTLIFDKDNTASIHLVVNYQFDESVTTMWILICSICAIVCVAIILFILFKRRREADDEYFNVYN